MYVRVSIKQLSCSSVITANTDVLKWSLARAAKAASVHIFHDFYCKMFKSTIPILALPLSVSAQI